jgi:hypothetical protein
VQIDPYEKQYVRMKLLASCLSDRECLPVTYTFHSSKYQRYFIANIANMANAMSERRVFTVARYDSPERSKSTLIDHG